jgi:hypothetical protein
LGLDDPLGLDVPVPPPTVPARIWPTLAFRLTGGAPGTGGVAGVDDVLALVVVVDEAELEPAGERFGVWAVLVFLGRDAAVA